MGSSPHLQWPLLDVLRHSWNRDGLLVEPGEIETETFDFIVQKDVESVAVKDLFLQRQGGWGRCRTTPIWLKFAGAGDVSGVG